MAAKYSLLLFCGGMFVGLTPAARLSNRHLTAISSSTDKVTNQTKRACVWGQEHCCCELSYLASNPKDVVCKKFLTGMVDGQEACKCGDAIVKEKLKLSGHQPDNWKRNMMFWNQQLYARSQMGFDLNPLYKRMDTMCGTHGGGVGIEFQGEEPAGSCTDERLFALAKQVSGEDKIECLDYLYKSTRRNRERLETSALMKSFDHRISGSALMGCAKIGLGCNRGSFQSMAIVTAISNVKTAEFIQKPIQNTILTKAKEMLKVESGLSDEIAQELLDWAFYHEEGQNPYCNPNTLADRQAMLVRGLTAAEPNHKVKDVAWKYGEEVYQPIKKLLAGTIDGMFAADCKKPEPWATLEEAKKGKGVAMSLSDDEWKAKIAEKDEAIDRLKERNGTGLGAFMHAHKLTEEIELLTAGNRLKEFAKLSPMIHTTLQYLESPVLEHQIEQNEADFVRLCMSTLANLLHNETFAKHLMRNGEFDNWGMPPELDGLWAKTRKAKYGERIWPDELIETFRQNKSKAQPPCDCKDIAPALGLHFLNMLPQIGLDFGNNVRMNSDGNLISDKKTETLKHVDLAGFAETMIMVEAGIADPIFAVKYITKVLLAYGEKGGSESGLPDVSASGKIKGVLVGMPIIQNLWSTLNEKTSPEVFAKKMKWFFVANIAWAVWHAIETPLPPEDIVLGLLTLAYSTLSSFKYDGESLVFSNSKEFTDQMLAVYTVWNYRFVQQWASNGKAKDQWMHVSVALSMPIIEALANHGDLRYYINYRRDDLFHSMLLMLKNK